MSSSHPCFTFQYFTSLSVLHLCRREEQIKAVEEEIRKERQMADRVVQSMPAAKQEKYFSMAATNEQLLQVNC